jgi:hypothetical protein
VPSILNWVRHIGRSVGTLGPLGVVTTAEHLEALLAFLLGLMDCTDDCWSSKTHSSC